MTMNNKELINSLTSPTPLLCVHSMVVFMSVCQRLTSIIWLEKCFLPCEYLPVGFVLFPTCSLAMSKQQAGSIKIKPKRLSIRRTRSPNRMGSEGIRHEGFDQDRESSLPPELRSRLWSLFAQIEREFECVHAENLARK